jgi:hypothetical protein
MNKNILAVVFLFISIFFINANAALRPATIVNDTTKICTGDRYSSRIKELSDGWRYLPYNETCESLGYSTNYNMNPFVLKPYYFYWFWGLISSELIILIVAGYFLFIKYILKKPGVSRVLISMSVLLFLIGTLLVVFYYSWLAIIPYSPVSYIGYM